MPSGDSFDERLLHWIDEHRIGAFTSIATRLMELGDTAWLWLAVALLGALVVVYKRAWREGLAVALALYAGGLISGQLKTHIGRDRPAFPDALVEVAGPAMPSSHAAFMMAMAVALLIVVRWRSRRELTIVASLLAAALMLIAVAMIYLGAHWATDVFAGWALGAVIGAAIGLVLRPRRRKTGADVAG